MVLAAYAVGSFEVRFNLLSVVRLKAMASAVALQFVVCSGFVLVAQGILAWGPVAPSFRKALDGRDVRLVGGMVTAFATRIPGMIWLGMTVAVVAPGSAWWLRRSPTRWSITTPARRTRSSGAWLPRAC